MKNQILAILFCACFLSLSGQEANILLNRDFWRSSPDVETIKEKIKAGNDPVAMTPFAFDATTYSIIDKAPIESTKYLLSLAGNEVSKITHDGRNYLLWAAYAGNVELVEYLIEKGSDINLVDDHGYAVIPFCATTGQSNTKVYDVLIKNGADLNSTNRDGANSILLIAKHLNEDLSMIDYFQSKGLKIDSKDSEGNGLFNYAAVKGNKVLMEKAIELGLPYKEENENGGNAMIFASRGYRGSVNPLSIYEYMEDLGIKANVVTKDGETPLHNIARRAKDPAIYEFFIKKDIDINQADASGNTMLLNAVNGSNNEIAMEYMDKVEDINHQNKDGHSALTYAVRRNNIALMKALMKEGADASVLDKDGNNLAAHLFQTYNDRNQDAFDEVLTSLQKEKVKFDVKQAKGNTLVHIAVDKNSEFLLNQALAMGGDLDVKNDDGLAPIHLAVMKAKDSSMINLLINKGADKSLKTDFEESVYDLAAENELLKKTGFDLDILKR
ncbi:MAG: ankyrin repeat domain-containing protein [Bacteroidota bacterium]